ncbi:acetolactate synthase II large subunit [Pseudooceanicola batsensis HTCC2597]|uniref:Acetolactate synthase II large subunit n=1 Tax=Pseudooceanicola batsensis (strain ATCC BAA-863 / DSM 15984 / KCTC 12145 / HTCC2597) TaxID=252305 RepID=A3U199_PSEBH|nr:thiamine pyrophosphate-dependent enzyme [Pseudooceanicola batsensis]EAQ02082.1 acetolactate synthase II large subunit [Pseudooceanicola batsensis HTCC2597]
MTRAADLLARSLIQHGIDRVFCVPGESYLSVLDAMVDVSELQVVTARHEGGAGFMAVADAKISGRTGVAFVSRGPGAMNAAIAVHTAQQDAVPFVLFVGQVERSHLGMNAFQEVDHSLVFGSMCKWTAEVRDADRVGDIVATALHKARSGTPGPVVVSLPEDMLDDAVSSVQVPARGRTRAAASSDDIARLCEMIGASHKPLIIAGGLLQTEEGREAVTHVAEKLGIPVAAAVRQIDVINNDHPNYAGHMGYGVPTELIKALSKSDLVVAVGARLGDVTSQGYTFPAAPVPSQPVIQIWPDANELGSFRDLAFGIAADPVQVLRQLAENVPERPDDRHVGWTRELHEGAVQLRKWEGPDEAEDGVVFGAVVRELDALLADDAIIASDAGNFGAWVQKVFRFGGQRRMLGPCSGAMGFGVPGAVAASLRFPDRQVVGFAGDGGVLMTGNELATALQYGACPVLVVSDNGSYGTIRMHQEKSFPNRLAMTDLKNPDFRAWAESFGALAFQIERAGEIRPTLEKALSAKRPALVAVRTSLEYISPTTTISQLNNKR